MLCRQYRHLLTFIWPMCGLTMITNKMMHKVLTIATTTTTATASGKTTTPTSRPPQQLSCAVEMEEDVQFSHLDRCRECRRFGARNSETANFKYHWVVSKMFLHPYLGRWSSLTNMFQTNQVSTCFRTVSVFKMDDMPLELVRTWSYCNSPFVMSIVF